MQWIGRFGGLVGSGRSHRSNKLKEEEDDEEIIFRLSQVKLDRSRFSLVNVSLSS